MEITLETDRLLLRAFRAADHAPYAEMCADPEVMRYLGTGVTLSPHDAWRSIRVAEKLGERLAGEVDLLGGKCLVYERKREEAR